MTEQEEQKKSRLSDWFGSGPFNWTAETLIGGMIVLIPIMAILAAILLPIVARLGDQGRYRAVHHEFKSMAEQMREYREDHGRLPDKSDWYKQIKICGKHFDHVPRDPWGTPVRFNLINRGDTDEILSAGRDRKFWQ